MPKLKNAALYAPGSYKKATLEQKRRICNGCGQKGKFDFVPDTVYGMSIAEACNIHDWMYELGKTETDRQEADLAFLNNMLRLVSAKGGWLKWLRDRRVLKYYEAVRELGGPAYWDPKNSGAEKVTVAVL